MPPPNDTAPAAIAEAQRVFVAALFSPDAPVPSDIANSTPARDKKRFDVYRNNVHASLATALGAKFPVIQRLVGEEFFRAMAVLFVERHPPASPVLIEYGSDFAIFLETFEPARELPYLADVARLEWARTTAYHAADAEPENLAALASIAPDDIAATRLHLHPAARIVASPYPIVSIWQTNTHDDCVRPIGPDHGAECALISRPQLDVLVTELPVASAAFVEALDSAGLGEAVRRATSADPLFDLSLTLSTLFTAGAVAGIDTPRPETV